MVIISFLSLCRLPKILPSLLKSVFHCCPQPHNIGQAGIPPAYGSDSNIRTTGRVTSRPNTIWFCVHPVLSCTVLRYANMTNGRCSSQSPLCPLAKVTNIWDRVRLNLSTIPFDCGLVF